MILMRDRILYVLHYIKDNKPKITPEIIKDVWNVLLYPFVILLIYNYTALIRNGSLDTLSIRIIYFFMYFFGWPLLLGIIAFAITFLNFIADWIVNFILSIFLHD